MTYATIAALPVVGIIHPMVQTCASWRLEPVHAAGVEPTSLPVLGATLPLVDTLLMVRILLFVSLHE